jgi:hypothetical protein
LLIVIAEATAANNIHRSIFVVNNENIIKSNRVKRRLESSITIQATCRENPSKAAKMGLRKPTLTGYIAITSTKEEQKEQR